MGAGRDDYSRLLAWSLLEGRDPAEFHGRSSALEAVIAGEDVATPTPKLEALATARFKTVKAAEPIEVTVHFNPASLQYTVSNTLKDQGSGRWLQVR